MQLIGHFIVRVIAIFFGLFVAMLAASIFLSFGIFSDAFNAFFADLRMTINGDPYAAEEMNGLGTALVIIIGFFSSFYVAGLAAMPITIAIAIAELMRWQSMTINLVLGGLIALITGLSVFAADHEGLPSDGTLVVLLATGFIGGFFYWLIAGRSAGKWLGTSTET
jgi:hypothetical protein